MNKIEKSIAAFDHLPLNPADLADLQSDHAGEAGAVMIYKGVLATSRDPAIRHFAAEHLATEQQHLAFFDRWLPARHHSRLLPVWKAAGWALGALAGLFGSTAVYRTVEAVETFVEAHYQAQISRMRRSDGRHRQRW